MKSEDARLGMKVKVLDGHKRSSQQGREGTIEHVYGHPSYAAFEVRFEGGGMDLFWHYEVGEAQESSLSWSR